MDEAVAALMAAAAAESDPDLSAAIMSIVMQVQHQMTLLRLAATAAGGSNAGSPLDYYLR